MIATCILLFAPLRHHARIVAGHARLFFHSMKAWMTATSPVMTHVCRPAMDEIAGTLSTWRSAAAVAARIGRKNTMDKALYDRGMAMRRKVLGDQYVDRAVANTDDFNRQFQDLLNEYCWGAVWSDDTLKPRDRSLLNLGMIACLGRMHEFEAHFRGALRNGLTPKELAAVLRQVAVYCGFPAAVDCHRVAKQVLAETNKA
jgi:4-carboxymuconolactone decarboxylase